MLLMWPFIMSLEDSGTPCFEERRLTGSIPIYNRGSNSLCRAVKMRLNGPGLLLHNNASAHYPCIFKVAKAPAACLVNTKMLRQVPPGH